jgi:hexosaminidase
MKNFAQKIPAVLAACLMTTSAFAANTNELPLIPWPQKVQRFDSEFHLTPQTRIYTDWGSRKTGRFLAAYLQPATGFPFKLKVKWISDAVIPNGILLTTRDANNNLGPEGYELTVSTNSVVIRAPAQAGLFYGVQTLRQLLPPEIFSSNQVTDADWRMPCVHIEDWPRFGWRGLMLDVSRHFYNTTEVERVLDLMALYKLNVFHWHLVDDQGWRIEIPQYPKLTEIGAWRQRSSLAPTNSTEIHTHPSWSAPTADKFAPDGRYGGFYTPKDIHKVVAYAAARHIIVIPEIEMPGHSTAALAAYPQFSCTGGPFTIPLQGGIFDGIYDPANPATFIFLESVLKEVFQLFPAKYVHIGGDEVRKNTWEKSPDSRALMKEEGFTNADQLQSYFVKRIAKFVSVHGKIPIGWSEILQGGLATNAVVMDWKGGGTEAAIAGHDVVMTPNTYCYLNFYQSTNYSAQPLARARYTPLRKVYSFDPIPNDLPSQDDSHILGAQANLWTEFVPSLPHAEYMLFPRLCALAEVVWSPKSSRDWHDFRLRLDHNEERLNELDINYYRNPVKEGENP